MSSNRNPSEIIESNKDKINAQNIKEVDNKLTEIIGVINLPKDFNEKEQIRIIMKEKQS